MIVTTVLLVVNVNATLTEAARTTVEAMGPAIRLTILYSPKCLRKRKIELFSSRKNEIHL